MAITHAATSGPIDLADWNAAHVGDASSLGYFNVDDYGAESGLGGDATANRTAFQACLTDAWDAPGGTMYVPPVLYLIDNADPLTVPTDSGEVAIIGGGRARRFSGGTSGDPTAAQGSVIRGTSTTDDVFLFESANTKTHLITMKNLAVEGNPTGTTGHGIHFKALGGAATCPDLTDVSVIDCAQNGIFYDGAIFESTIIRGRLNSNGESGFKAALNTGGIPGEVRMVGTCLNLNDLNIDIAGGGNFNLYGITSSYARKSIEANGVGLTIDGYQFEGVGQDAPTGSKCTFTNLRGGDLRGFIGGCDTGDTGIGLEFSGCIATHVSYYYAESTASGVGYRDFSFATSSRCSMDGYMNNDDVDRYDLGDVGGNVVKRGNQWLSAQHHAMKEHSSSSAGDDDLNLILYDSFVSKRTGSGGFTRTIRFPNNWNTGQRNGHRVTIHVYNATSGSITTSWNSFWGLAGAWVDPAAGKMRSIIFEYTGYGYVEIGRSAADVTPAF